MTAVRAAEALLPVEEAVARLLARVSPTAAVDVAIEECAGMVLAENVVASRPLPPADNSAMDGFAVRAGECAAGVELPVAGETRAGDPVATLEPGTARAIMTGAPVPHGADAVVRVEDTRTPSPGRVAVLVAPRPGQNIRRRGEDAAAGALMVAAGTRLRAVDVAACAAAGTGRVRVHRRPTVAVLTAGDELVAPGAAAAEHQIIDSNRPMLLAAIRDAGGEPLVLDSRGDDRDALAQVLRDAAARCDLVVSSAGVSVGRHDHLPGLVAELGGIDAWRVALRPGRPLLCGHVAGTPIVALPGNPVSSAVTFALAAAPAIRALQGARETATPRCTVRLADDVRADATLEVWLRARVERVAGDLPLAHVDSDQGSGMLRTLAASDVVVRIPQGAGALAGGDTVEAMALP